MSTVQQIGLIGNSVKVQSLPTASAATFGEGNRFYTLIGQQEGYITGHTYHTVVANDVYSWEDVAGGASDYNELDNIPVINQDLSASDFTPVANTYYRHTGATTDTFTQGIIYLYDTVYHKLGESGGTTLNKYTYTIHSKPAYYAIGRVYNIMHAAKGRVYARTNFSSYWQTAEIFFAETGSGGNTLIIRDASTQYGDENYFPIIKYYNYMTGKDYYTVDSYTYQADGTVSHTHNKYGFGTDGVQIIYYNDTEIT